MLVGIHLVYLTDCTSYLSLAFLKCAENSYIHLQWGEGLEEKPNCNKMSNISHNERETQSEVVGPCLTECTLLFDHCKADKTIKLTTVSQGCSVNPPFQRHRLKTCSVLDCHSVVGATLGQMWWP